MSDWRPVDLGEREGAMGSVQTDGNGVPILYEVADGDSADAIRGRFNLWWDSLAGQDGTRLPRYPDLYVGDLLRFIEPDPRNHLPQSDF